jgi:hypothetical protein
MSSTNPSIDSTLQHLREVRKCLLRLHKALLDSERIGYEQFYGPIQSSGEFLGLVIDHEWFNWLHPISQFIVQIDEIIFSKEAVSLDQVNELLDKTRTLLQPDEEGSEMEVRYNQALQRDAGLALMHGELMRMLKN